ncbi:hypothetical protein ACQPTN_17400 [Bradyrhizobium sp. 13971]
MNRALAALRIGFIGAGRVAQTLAPAFARVGLNVAAFHNRRCRCRAAARIRIPSARPMTGRAACRRQLRHGFPHRER